MNTVQNSSYGNIIASLKREGRFRQDIEHQKVKYLNNGIDPEHAPIKKLNEANGGFKVRGRVWPKVQGSEGIQMLNSGKCDFS
ncbi:DDE-type integrase/transposase/recombinase [Vibrio sp. nBUS_14]|uniref:DDE-type integrase/transposase/recombinase n=1 Tax=unclassified Vibrio TaxID=2614977 RepID=UPI003EB88028